MPVTSRRTSSRLRFSAVPKFAQLRRLLGLSKPRFETDRSPHLQLDYILRYLSDVRLGQTVQSIAIESGYTDRDYMEDYSAFYASSLQQFGNQCQRIHFFAIPSARAKRELERLARLRPKGEELFKAACVTFSNAAYLGYSVIKPLNGSPVGRTVLRYFPVKTDSGNERRFDCTLSYIAHVGGVPLTVRGLAFQQQDLGVSACATTAVWSAIHKVKDFEQITLPTPARVTTLAVQHSLIHGRAMPSEGLSIDQMCLAIRGLGLSPNLLRMENYLTMRAYLHAAVQSGIAAVLTLEQDAYVGHAVTLAGMKLERGRIPSSRTGMYYDRSANLKSVYVHDDRVGPYVTAELVNMDDHLVLTWKLGDQLDRWIVSHILLPVHSKVRLGFAALRKLTLDIVREVAGLLAMNDLWVPTLDGRTGRDRIAYDFRITPANRYLDSLMASRRGVDVARRLDNDCRLSRYVGVVSLELPTGEPLDVLVDTTSVERNIHYIGVVSLRGGRLATAVAETLAHSFDCPAV